MSLDTAKKNSKLVVKSRVRISVNPNKITRGQMLNVSAEIYDSITGKPLVFDRIYMQILDKDGVEVWPLSTIELNSSQVNKLISTSEMKAGKYTVRISPSKKLTPQASFTFEVETTTLAVLVPLIPLILLARPSGVVKEKVEKEFIGPIPPPKIEWIIYRTEKDSRVCPICLPNEGLLFRPDDPTLIRIGALELGGDTHYNCRCHYDIVSDVQIRKAFFDAAMEEFQAKQKKLKEIHQIYLVSEIAKQSFKMLRSKTL